LKIRVQTGAEAQRDEHMSHPFQVQIYRPRSGLLIWEHCNLPLFPKKIPIAALLVVSQRINRDLSDDELFGNALYYCATQNIACAILTTPADVEMGKLLSHHLLERFSENFGDELKVNDQVPALDLTLYSRFSNELYLCIRLSCQTAIADILRRERSVSYVLCAYQKTGAMNYSLLCSNQRSHEVDVDEVALLSSITPAIQIERRCLDQLKLLKEKEQIHQVITLTISTPSLQSLSLYTCGRLALVIKHAKQSPPKDIIVSAVPTLHTLCDLCDTYKE